MSLSLFFSLSTHQTPVRAAEARQASTESALTGKAKEEGRRDRGSDGMRAAGGAARLKPPAVDDEAGEPTAGRAGAAGAGRKKGAAGLRAWLAVDAGGQAQALEAGKQAIMRRTGLPGRDLRILDPLLSYPSTILGRERAIVINLEHIKALVTAHELLLLNFRDPAVAPFVHELQRRLHLHRLASSAPARAQQESGEMEQPPSWNASPPLGYPVDFCGLREVGGGEDGEDASLGKRASSNNSVGQKVLPFEFIALETCLEAACTCLENETRTLEQEAHPALDKLTSKISTLNLERVRQIKSRLVAITGRVQKVRDELEHLLDDDDDMAEMYLTEKLTLRCDSSGSSSRRDMGNGRVPPDILFEGNDSSSNYEEEHLHIENEDLLFSGSNVVDGSGRGTRTSSTRSGSKHLDVEELEMLLEAYFVQIDGTLNQLSTVVTSWIKCLLLCIF
uniref:Magnesium transporter n=1 Tax=Anthurium amnicola TaxID=1678845 RepID=A0A1D1XP27_9ARAE